MADREPIEPDEILPAGGAADLGIVRDPTLDQSDTSWIEAMGFEVTRAAPPVGSVTVGVPGVGFDLYVPDEHGRRQLTEAYGPDGKRVAQSALTGHRVPGELPEGDGSQEKGTKEASECKHPDHKGMESCLHRHPHG